MILVYVITVFMYWFFLIIVKLQTWDTYLQISYMQFRVTQKCSFRPSEGGVEKCHSFLYALSQPMMVLHLESLAGTQTLSSILLFPSHLAHGTFRRSFRLDTLFTLPPPTFNITLTPIEIPRGIFSSNLALNVTLLCIHSTVHNQYFSQGGGLKGAPHVFHSYVLLPEWILFLSFLR